jgi:hypothetical protein
MGLISIRLAIYIVFVTKGLDEKKKIAKSIMKHWTNGIYYGSGLKIMPNFDACTNAY